MDLSNKKILMVVAPENFRDEEYLETKKALEEYLVKIAVASTKIGKARGVGGVVIDIDLTLNEINFNNYDGIVFVGGPGMAEMVEHRGLIQLAQKFYNNEKIVAAICVAPAILAKAGILANKRATGWEGVKEELIKNDVHYTGMSVEVDNKIVTANGPRAAHEFGHKIIELLNIRVKFEKPDLR